MGSPPKWPDTSPYAGRSRPDSGRPAGGLPGRRAIWGDGRSRINAARGECRDPDSRGPNRPWWDGCRAGRSAAAKRGAVYQFIGWNYQAASPGRLPFPLLRDHPALRTPQGAGVKKEGGPAELGSLRVVSHLNQPLQLVGSADRREEKNI